jgi:CarD family transcriptional regulator
MATKTPQEPVIGDGSLHVGDRVVYPNQGICRITGVETKQIAGQNWEVVTLSREEDGATVMVPKAKVMGIGLRKVADVTAIERVFDELATPNTDPQLDWKVRHRENADRMSGGGLFGTVEILKGLHALSRVRPLPQKERELYDNARHLLVGEIAAAMDIPLHVAEDNLDYALWPPEGMTRKGKPLPPATLGPPSPARAAGDDDLGFEDEDMGTEEAAAPAATPQEPDEDEDEDEEEEKPAAPEKKPAAAAPPKSKAAPPRADKAHAAAAHPPAERKTRPPPPRKAAPAKKAAAKKPAAKAAAKKAPPKKAAKAKGKR